MLGPLLGERVVLSLRLAAEPSRVLADANQLEQILINLLVNARDAMPTGGTVLIATHAVSVDDPRRQEIDLPGPGPLVRISVTDSGRGMDDETKRRAFDPFFTTKRPGEGTGLGLAMVHGLMAQHGGVANIVSEIGQGATLELYLPTVASQEVVVEQAQIATGATSGQETILFVDDDDMVRRLTHKLLTTAGYSVLLAQDGAEAVKLIAQHAEKVDLALLDFAMPKVGGEEVFRVLREQRPDVPVVFATGHGAQAITSVAGSRNVDFILKPYSRDELLSRIRRALDSGGTVCGP
jgi:CheY-like chemotaxis protein